MSAEYLSDHEKEVLEELAKRIKPETEVTSSNDSWDTGFDKFLKNQRIRSQRLRNLKLTGINHISKQRQSRQRISQENERRRIEAALQELGVRK